MLVRGLGLRFKHRLNSMVNKHRLNLVNKHRLNMVTKHKLSIAHKHKLIPTELQDIDAPSTKISPSSS